MGDGTELEKDKQASDQSRQIHGDSKGMTDQCEGGGDARKQGWEECDKDTFLSFAFEVSVLGIT